MTLNELIAKLEEIKEQFGDNGEMEVRLMSQPNWPFEWTIRGVTCNHFFPNEEDEYEPEDGEDLPEPEEVEPIIYVCEGTQLGYGNRDAWDNLI